VIIKQPADVPTPADPRLAAGVAAERQMAFYLNRAMATDPDLLVLNDLRLIDDLQPEPDGSPGVCQIDHLVLHRWGAFIIESKSVSEEVIVSSDGTGGDVWTRRFRGRQEGMPSPIQQARRQAEFLREMLQRSRAAILGKLPTGTRTIAKLLLGSDQRGFRNMPIQIIVAISDRGRFETRREWSPPTEPFRAFVTKADLVAEKVRTEFDYHRKQSGLVRQQTDKYGMWYTNPEEVPVVAAFLLQNHVPRASNPQLPSAAPSSPPRSVASAVSTETATPARTDRKTAPVAAPIGPACKACLSPDLVANWGKFGYYWKCNACGTNTAMPTACSACGTEGQRGQVVRIRKDGPKYFRDCESCGISERIWTQS
jgi:hypothetical protein